jgi:hypothetical protein
MAIRTGEHATELRDRALIADADADELLARTLHTACSATSDKLDQGAFLGVLLKRRFIERRRRLRLRARLLPVVP